jgi:hypothetical protein
MDTRIIDQFPPFSQEVPAHRLVVAQKWRRNCAALAGALSIEESSTVLDLCIVLIVNVGVNQILARLWGSHWVVVVIAIRLQRIGGASLNGERENQHAESQEYLHGVTEFTESDDL